MWIGAFLSTVIGLLYNDDLLASLAALEDNCNLGILLLIKLPGDRNQMCTFPGL